MVNRLLLHSGQPIPFYGAKTILHPPRLKDIGIMGGQTGFYSGCGLLTFQKESLVQQDKKRLEGISDFDIIMTVLKQNSLEAKKQKLNVLSILAILFPNFNFEVEDNKILMLTTEQDEQNKVIDNNNFPELKELLEEVCCLKRRSGKNNEAYNAKSQLAKRIADKIKEGRNKRSKNTDEKEKEICILDRYATILSIGMNKDINTLMNYTIYQLYEEFEVYQAKLQYDYFIDLKRAGAKDLKQPRNWMEDLHEPEDKEADDLSDNQFTF